MPVYLALLPVLAQSSEPDGRQQNEKRSALGHVLVHVQQINHSRHENDASSNAQKAHQHTSAKSQQKDDECHGERSTLGVLPNNSHQALSFSSLRAPAATSDQGQQHLKMRPVFCLRGTCYIYMSLSRRPVACWRLCSSPQYGIPENVNLLAPARLE